MNSYGLSSADPVNDLARRSGPRRNRARRGGRNHALLVDSSTKKVPNGRGGMQGACLVAPSRTLTSCMRSNRIRIPKPDSQRYI